MGEWQNGLFGCLKFDKLFLCAWCIPCHVNGLTAEKMGQSYIMYCLCGNLPCCAANLRQQIRESKGIEGSKANDCLTVIFCGMCALCQEAREVEAIEIERS